MSTPTAARTVQLQPTNPRLGCTGCGSPDTETLDPVHGRRCAACPPRYDPRIALAMGTDGGAYARATLPPGRFDRGLADDMLTAGRYDAALAYLAAWLARETGARFAAAAGRLAVTR